MCFIEMNWQYQKHVYFSFHSKEQIQLPTHGSLFFFLFLKYCWNTVWNTVYPSIKHIHDIQEYLTTTSLFPKEHKTISSKVLTTLCQYTLQLRHSEELPLWKSILAPVGTTNFLEHSSKSYHSVQRCLSPT